MKTTRSFKNIFLIPMLILLLGLILVNCGDGDDGYDDGSGFKLYETSTIPGTDMAFAQSVALSGNWAVVSTVSANLPSFYSYNYGTSFWVLNIGVSDAGLFEVSVGISGDYVIMGESESSDSGKECYVGIYTNDKITGLWHQSGLVQSNYGQFGFSVGISGTKAIVGAPGTDTVYFYDVEVASNVLTNERSITTNLGTAEFGYSVDIDGDYAIIGSYASNDITGSAYVYHNISGAWSQVAVFSNSFKAMKVGGSVAICGNNAILSANEGTQRATIFYNNGSEWVKAKDISWDGFSTAQSVVVAISSNYALIGEINGSGRGSVRIYKNNSGSWTDMGEHFAVDGMSAIGLALNDYRMIVGEDKGSQGWVHFYE